MHINPFKRIADLEARIAQMEKQAAATMATTSAAAKVMAKLPSIAVLDQALEALKILDRQVDNLMSENKARKVGAEHLDKRISALGEEVVLLKALRNVVTPEEASRMAIDNQLARDKAKREKERIKQRGYNAAYRARQKAKAAEEAKRAKRREYQRAWKARKKAEQAAALGAAK